MLAVAVRASDSDSGSGDSQPAFVGREAELSVVQSCARDAAAGRARVAWVEGGAGSGKTALLQQVLRGLPPGFRVVSAESDELAVDVPLAVVRQLAPVGPAAAPFAVGLELLASWAARQEGGPVLVMVEDLHWADAGSRLALLAAARRLGEDRVLLVVTSRPGMAADGWERFRSDEGRCRRVTLQPLSPADVSELAVRTGVSLSRPAAERLHRHTLGLPLYVRTLLTELTPAQLAAPEGELPVPRSLASTTVARLAGLPSEARALAAALAVLNTGASLAVVAAVAGVERAAAPLEALLASGFVSWQSLDPVTPVTFVHPLYRSAVYEDLPPTRRQALHRAAASVLDSAAALAHRVAAADETDDVLADELAQAAERHAHTESRSLAAHYLLLAAPLSSRPAAAELRLLTAILLLLADGQPVRAGALRDRAEACADGALRSLVLGRLHWEQGNAVSAEWWLADCVRTAERDGTDAEVLAAALASLGVVLVTQGRAGDAVDVAGRSLALTPRDAAVERGVWTVLAVGEGMLHGAPAGLRRLAERLPQAPAEVPGLEADLLITRGTLGFYAGRTTAAIVDLRAAVRLARQGSAPAQLPRAHLHLAQLLVSSGDWDEALVHARVALSLVSDEQRVWMLAQAHAAVAAVLASRGNWSEADRQVAAAAEAAVSAGTSEAVFTARIAAAAAARARDEPRRTVEALGPLVAGGDGQALPMFTSLGWWPVLIAALVDVGEVDTAERQLAWLKGAAADRGLELAARILGLQARVELARGEQDAAAATFDVAISTLGEDDPQLDRALVHHSYGRLLRARGERRRAVEQLRAAHLIVERLGARPFLARVVDDLSSCGLRAPSDRTDPGVWELTEREQDVAALVAKGLTNREVAAELYVSEKAVEYHLRHVFGKTGITSRRHLRARLTS